MTREVNEMELFPGIVSSRGEVSGNRLTGAIFTVPLSPWLFRVSSEPCSWAGREFLYYADVI